MPSKNTKKQARAAAQSGSDTFKYVYYVIATCLKAPNLVQFKKVIQWTNILSNDSVAEDLRPLVEWSLQTTHQVQYSVLNASTGFRTKTSTFNAQDIAATAHQVRNMVLASCVDPDKDSIDDTVHRCAVAVACYNKKLGYKPGDSNAATGFDRFDLSNTQQTHNKARSQALKIAKHVPAFKESQLNKLATALNSKVLLIQAEEKTTKQIGK